MQIAARLTPQQPIMKPNQAPPTEQRPVVDNYHGQEVVDKFRWLEDGTSEEVKNWTKLQNAHTDSHLKTIPQREQVVERLTELFSGKNATEPYSVGGREFVYKREAGQNQAALYMKNAEGAFEAVLDPNKWSDQGTEALDWMYHSPNGKYIAYGRSSGGDEWSRHVLNLETKQETGEVIPRTRAASLAWESDESGFYYTRYPEPGSVPEGEEDYHRHVFHHELGQDPANDPKIYGEGLPKEAWTSIDLSDDNKKLLLSVSQGWTRTDLLVQDLESGERTVIHEGKDGQSQAQFIEDGKKLQILTTLDAPRGRLVEVDLANPTEGNWKELLPQDPEATLQAVERVDGKVYANYLRDAHSEVSVFTPGSDNSKLQSQGKVELPGIGTVSGMKKTDDGKLRFEYASYNFPNATMELDPAKSKPEVKSQNEVPFNFQDYEVKQEFFRSVDGEKIPMFIVHKKGLEPDGNTPTLLYGYGGFDVSLTPGFSKSTAHWLEQGGIYAVATLRGGGEYGAEWHEAGMLEKKQNVFDDFISAGQHLVTAGYTKPEKMAVAGGSNGGLLTGAAVTQAPELMEAAIVAVPLLDMVRYDEFGIAKLWRAEYGSSNNEAQFEYIRDYSPYQNVESKLERLGQPYPATLLMAGEKDSRTDPLHARKMTAELQLAQGADQAAAPILLRVEADAGHGAGKPVGKVVEAEADKWIFLQQQLGMLTDQ